MNNFYNKNIRLINEARREKTTRLRNLPQEDAWFIALTEYLEKKYPNMYEVGVFMVASFDKFTWYTTKQILNGNFSKVDKILYDYRTKKGYSIDEYLRTPGGKNIYESLQFQQFYDTTLSYISYSDVVSIKKQINFNIPGQRG